MNEEARRLEQRIRARARRLSEASMAAAEAAEEEEEPSPMGSSSKSLPPISPVRRAARRSPSGGGGAGRLAHSKSLPVLQSAMKLYRPPRDAAVRTLW